MSDAFTKVEKIGDYHHALYVGDNAYALSENQKYGFELLSTETLARLRIACGGHHQVSWTGARLTDCFIHSEGRNFLWKAGPESPLHYPLAQSFHEQNSEIPLDDMPPADELYELPLESFALPVATLQEEPLAHFLLGEELAPYQEWLQGLSIRHLPFALPEYSLLRHITFALVRPLVMRCTDNWSGLIAAGNLHQPYGVRGVSANATPEAKSLATPVETFTREALTPYAKLLGLEDSSYTLPDLVESGRAAGQANILGVVLRLLRGGSDLPVSHETFRPEESDG